MMDPYFTTPRKLRPLRRVRFDYTRAHRRRMKPVECIETGVRYESASAAARDARLAENYIAMAIKNRNGRAGGKTYRYLEVAST